MTWYWRTLPCRPVLDDRMTVSFANNKAPGCMEVMQEVPALHGVGSFTADTAILWLV
jgi:hypothetical protein